MATALLFIGWDRPVAGKEKEAWKYFMEEGDAALDQVPETGILRARRTRRAHAAQRDLNGFVLLFGERAKLDELRRTDEFERFSISLGMLFEGYGVIPGLNNEGLQKAMGRMKDLARRSARRQPFTQTTCLSSATISTRSCCCFMTRVDVLVGLGGLVDDAGVLAALDARGLILQIAHGEALARLAAAHAAAGAVRRRLERARVAEAAHDVRLRAHRARDDAQVAAPGADRALARDQQLVAEVDLLGDVVVVARDRLGEGDARPERAHHVRRAGAASSAG